MIHYILGGLTGWPMFHIIFRPRMSAAIIIIQILVVLLGNPVGTKISFIFFTVEYSSFCTERAGKH